ncbi:MAG: hypothetical protein M1812_002177 [Candelaria pacifica]|nr:MAG: hypothetical protein M1812_002177 [Candelaria pacifica]
MAYSGRGYGGGRMGGADRYGNASRPVHPYSDDSSSSQSDSDIPGRRAGGYGGGYGGGRYGGGMGPPPRGQPPRGPPRGPAYGGALSSDGFDDSSTVDSSDGRSTPPYGRRGPPGGGGPGRPDNIGNRSTNADRYGRTGRGPGGARGGHAPIGGAGRGGYPMRDPRGQGPPSGNRGPPGYPGRSMGSDSESDAGFSDGSSLGGPPMGGYGEYAGRRGPGGGYSGGAMRGGIGGRMPGYGDPRAGQMGGRPNRDPFSRGGPPRGYAPSSDADSDSDSDVSSATASAYGPSARRYGGRY